MFQAETLKKSTATIYSDGRKLFAFLAAVFTAMFFVRLWQYGWMVNDDGSLYLYAAKNYQQDGLAAALKTYPWAYYSVLIAWVDTLFFDNLLISGWCLNFIFQAGVLFYLYRILGLLNISREKIFWVLLLFIISISFHNFRNYIMRDQGFLMFITMGVYYSLAFVNHGRLTSLTISVIFFLMSALFRVEGMVLMLAGIIGCCFIVARYRILFVFCAILATGFLVISMVLPANDLAMFQGYIFGKVPNLIQVFETQREVLKENILHNYWSDYSGIALFSMYLSSYIYYLLGSLSLYLLGFFYLKSGSNNASSQLLWVYGLTVGLYCLLFLFSRGFLIFRYNLPLTYMLTVVSIVAVTGAFISKRRYALAIMLLFIIIPLGKALSGPSGSKRYLLEAQHVVEKMELSGKSVLSNARQILLLNDVEYKKTTKLVKNYDVLYKKIRQPLKDDQAAIIYTYVDIDLQYSEQNCIVYSKENRKRRIVVLVAKSTGCQSAI